MRITGCVIVCVMGCLAFGCVSKKIVVIKSDPVGAQVKINDDQVGITPLSYVFEDSGNWFRTPEDFVVEAEMQGFNRDIVVFDGNNVDFIPPIIYFKLKKENMTKAKAAETVAEKNVSPKKK